MRHRAPRRLPLKRPLRTTVYLLVAVFVLGGAALVITDALRTGSFDSPSGEATAAAARLGTTVSRGAVRAPLPPGVADSPAPAHNTDSADIQPPGNGGGQATDRRASESSRPASPLDGVPLPVNAPAADRNLQHPDRQLKQAAGQVSQQSPSREHDVRSNPARQTGATEAGDGTAPQTTLLSGPSSEGDSALTFTANEPATFTCSLDGGSYQPCTSGLEYGGLGAGWHTFAVRATDHAGNVDQSPDSWRWHLAGSGLDKVRTANSD